MARTYRRSLGLAVGLVVSAACGGESSTGAGPISGGLDAGVVGAAGTAAAAGSAGQGGAGGEGGAAGTSAGGQGGTSLQAAGTGGTAGSAGTAGSGGTSGEAGTGGVTGSAGSAGTAGTGGSGAAGTAGTGGAAAGSGGSGDGEGGTDSGGSGGDDGEGGSDNGGTGGSSTLPDGGVCQSDGFSGEPAAPPTGGVATTQASVGDCPAFAPVPLGNQQWAIIAVQFLDDGSANVLIENVSGAVDGFGDLFSVCNEQRNCVFVHDTLSGLPIPAGGMVEVNVPDTTAVGGELAIYTNNLSIPHPEFCDLLGRAFSFHIVQWGAGPAGDHSLLGDAIRDFDWWTPGDLISIGSGDTGFSVVGATDSEDGYVSCNPTL